MKVFQNLPKYDPYLPFFERKYKVDEMSFEEHRRTLINDRFYALHLLKPVLDFDEGSFYTMWSYEKLQLKWAKEKGWNETDLKKIVFAQIEEYQPDVFYNGAIKFFNHEELEANIDPKIIRICWSASPYDQEELFKSYKSRLTNLPLSIRPASECGYRNDLFTPAHDPVMDQLATNEDRPIDLFFYGQYADDAFKNRNAHLDRLLEFKLAEKDLNIEFCLQYRIRKEPVVNIPYVRRFWQKKVFPSDFVIENAAMPTYGLDLYKKLSQSKIVFNAGVDFTKNHKVNMRNFEVLGCGAHMISDQGIYPDGFEMDKHFSTYQNIDECLEKVKALLKNDELRMSIAKAGNSFVKQGYTKENQWNMFQNIVASL